MCFATDYPYELGKALHMKTLLCEINRLQLSALDKKKLFGENVKHAFRSSDSAATGVKP